MKLSEAMVMMIFFTSSDPQESILLVCELFWDNRKLSGIFGANANYNIFDYYGPSSFFFRLRLFSNTLDFQDFFMPMGIMKILTSWDLPESFFRWSVT
jgi:hypothetical protein